MAKDKVTRRLTAVLVADVVGYSRLIGEDEEGTVARLKALRKELIDPNIEKHNGRVVKTMGDGILAEFPSVVDAVRNAVEVQRGMAARTASTTLGNSASMPSPISLTIRPLCSAILGSMRSERRVFRAASVPSSSARIRREYPTTSVARMAARRRSIEILPAEKLSGE